jgi:hypothetical protein
LYLSASLSPSSLQLFLLGSSLAVQATLELRQLAPSSVQGGLQVEVVRAERLEVVLEARVLLLEGRDELRHVGNLFDFR